MDDGIGRPAAWFAGDVGQVPALLPLAELLDLPEGHHADDVVRMVRTKDRARAERLVIGALFLRRLYRARVNHSEVAHGFVFITHNKRAGPPAAGV